MANTYSYNQLSGFIQKSMDRINEFNEIPYDLITLKPDPTSWSTTEIIQHIGKFNNLYLREIDKALQTNEAVTTQHDQFKPRFIFRQFIRFLNPPYKIKTKTVAPLYPNNTVSETPEMHLEHLKSTNQTLIDLISEFQKNHLDLNRIQGKNPVFTWISMTLLDYILVLDAHQRRHFWQIEQTLLKLSGQRY